MNARAIAADLLAGAAIVALSLGVRLGAAALWGINVPVGSDPAIWGLAAEAWWHEGSVDLPPLYPAIAALVANAGPEVPSAAQGVSRVLGALIPLVVFVGARTARVGRGIAAGVALVAALAPDLVVESLTVQPEALVGLLFAVAATGAFAWARGAWAGLVLFAAAVAGLGLAREHGLALLVPAALFAGAAAPRGRRVLAGVTVLVAAQLAPAALGVSVLHLPGAWPWAEKTTVLVEDLRLLRAGLLPSYLQATNDAYPTGREGWLTMLRCAYTADLGRALGLNALRAGALSGDLHLLLLVGAVGAALGRTVRPPDAPTIGGEGRPDDLAPAAHLPPGQSASPPPVVTDPVASAAAPPPRGAPVAPDLLATEVAADLLATDPPGGLPFAARVSARPDMAVASRSIGPPAPPVEPPAAGVSLSRSVAAPAERPAAVPVAASPRAVAWVVPALAVCLLPSLFVWSQRRHASVLIPVALLGLALGIQATRGWRRTALVAIAALLGLGQVGVLVNAPAWLASQAESRRSEAVLGARLRGAGIEAVATPKHLVAGPAGIVALYADARFVDEEVNALAPRGDWGAGVALLAPLNEDPPAAEWEPIGQSATLEAWRRRGTGVTAGAHATATFPVERGVRPLTPLTTPSCSATRR